MVGSITSNGDTSDRVVLALAIDSVPGRRSLGLPFTWLNSFTRRALFPFCVIKKHLASREGGTDRFAAALLHPLFCTAPMSRDAVRIKGSPAVNSHPALHAYTLHCHKICSVEENPISSS